MNSTRETNGQTWQGRTATCRNCETSHTFTGAQLNRDHELCIEMIPCHADDCLAMLCENCPQFACDGCGLAHCEQHAHKYDSLKLCPICWKGLQANDSDLASQDEAALVVALAERALDDAALIGGAGLTDREARAFLAMQSEAVN